MCCLVFKKLKLRRMSDKELEKIVYKYGKKLFYSESVTKQEEEIAEEASYILCDRSDLADS